MSELQDCCLDLEPLAFELVRANAACVANGFTAGQINLIAMLGAANVWLLSALETELFELSATALETAKPPPSR